MAITKTIAYLFIVLLIFDAVTVNGSQSKLRKTNGVTTTDDCMRKTKPIAIIDNTNTQDVLVKKEESCC